MMFEMVAMSHQHMYLLYMFGYTYMFAIFAIYVFNPDVSKGQEYSFFVLFNTLSDRNEEEHLYTYIPI